MDNVIDWLNTKPYGTRIGLLLAIATLPLVLVTVTALVFSPAAPVGGAVAGAALFLSAYGYWKTVLSEDKQAQTDLKARYALKQRRGIVGAAFAVWVIIVLLAGPALPAPAIGTLNVFVIISLYWLWRATPTEAAEALAAWEAAQAEAEDHDDLDADDRTYATHDE